MISVNIRSIQHFLYCPRRYGLLEINNDWAENAYVVKANIMHEKVHSGEHSYSNKNGFSESSIILYNDNLDIYGVADCIEFKKSKTGDFIYNDEKYKVILVEYKPSKPKNDIISETDAIQVFAQKLCADYMFNCNCDGYLYYSDVKRRVKLPFDTEYQKFYSIFENCVTKMRQILEDGNIPQREKNKKCSGCSLSDICMPKNTNVSIKKQILNELKE